MGESKRKAQAAHDAIGHLDLAFDAMEKDSPDAFVDARNGFEKSGGDMNAAFLNRYFNEKRQSLALKFGICLSKAGVMAVPLVLEGASRCLARYYSHCFESNKPSEYFNALNLLRLLSKISEEEYRAAFRSALMIGLVYLANQELGEVGTSKKGFINRIQDEFQIEFGEAKSISEAYREQAELDSLLVRPVSTPDAKRKGL